MLKGSCRAAGRGGRKEEGRTWMVEHETQGLTLAPSTGRERSMAMR